MTTVVIIECGRFDGLELKPPAALIGQKRLIAGTRDPKVAPEAFAETDLPIQMSQFAVLYEIRELHDRDSKGRIRAYPIANAHGIRPYAIERKAK